MDSNGFYTSSQNLESDSSKDTFKIIKESWKNYSKQQRLQFAGIIALVLVIPALVGGVATAKFIASRAAPGPITPPYSPTPTSFPKETTTPRPTPVPNTPTPTPVACIQRVQTVSLSPTNQTGLPGTSLTYSVTVINNNSQGCPEAEFSLSTLVSAGWTGLVSDATLSLKSGESGAADVIFTSALNAVSNSYPVTVLTNGPIAQVGDTSGYRVVVPPPTPTATPFTKPTPSPTATATAIATAIPNSNPVISTLLLPVGRIGKSYRANILGYSQSIDRLTMDINGLPNNLTRVFCSSQILNSRTTINCPIAGNLNRSGWFTVKVGLRGTNGDSTTRNIPLVVLPF